MNKKHYGTISSLGVSTVFCRDVRLLSQGIGIAQALNTHTHTRVDDEFLK